LISGVIVLLQGDMTTDITRMNRFALILHFCCSLRNWMMKSSTLLNGFEVC